MKTIGLVGGLTWVLTIDYYRLLNEKCSGNKEQFIFIIHAKAAVAFALDKETPESHITSIQV